MKQFNIIILFLSLLSTGCRKDKEFINQDSFAEFAIKYPSDTSIVIPQYDTLKINPVISGIDNRKNYSYEWKVYVDDEPRIISTDRNIAVEVALPEGNYSLQFSVKEESTGVRAISNVFSINVTGSFYEGWLVTNNINGKGQMSFLRSDDEVILNPLEEVNNVAYPGKAVGTIALIADNFRNSTVNQIMYFTDKGLTMFDPATLLQISTTNQNLFSPISFIERPAYNMNSYYIDQYLIGNGSLYMAFGPLFGGGVLETFSSRIEGDYSLYPYVFLDASGSAFFYDNRSKKFFVAYYYERTIDEAKSIGKTMLGADKTTNSNRYLSLLKEGNSYATLICNLNSYGTSTYTEQVFYPVEIDEAPVFAASSLFYHGYYSAGNKIYKVNANNGEISLVYTFESGSKIGDIQIMKEGDDSNQKLVVGVNNDTSGEVHYIYLDSQGNYDSSRTPKVFTGFGTIVHLNYRTAS
ncbi:PKD-like family lipoprotein [Sphingobacterium sp. UBA6645]|uniref:PKD-like family lipoprotein n=1 Tax=Sphingobacterium sp. UBA6645 TaxID=1947511 RepID=UPI0025E99C03|nr:PKD-like family lipoprotein [Sphingobacterium sp. UBA6645]